MTEADIRRLSRSMKNAETVALLTRDGTTYIGCPLVLRIASAHGRLVGEIVMRLSDGTKELVDFGEVIQVRIGNDGDVDDDGTHEP